MKEINNSYSNYNYNERKNIDIYDEIFHDFKNIFMVIHGNVAMLKNESSLNDNLSLKIRNIESSLLKGLNYCIDTYANLKYNEKIKENYNINSIILNLYDDLNACVNENKIKLNIDLDNNIGNIKCSKMKIEHIIINLVLNAIEAIEEKIDNRLEYNTIDITTKLHIIQCATQNKIKIPCGNYVKLSIRDSGNGINNKINSNEISNQNFGVGLSLVFRYIEENDAYMNIQTSNKGTQFDIFFPIKMEN